MNSLTRILNYVKEILSFIKVREVKSLSGFCQKVQIMKLLECVIILNTARPGYFSGQYNYTRPGVVFADILNYVVVLLVILF